jgi:Flp pilus assembly protein TadD
MVRLSPDDAGLHYQLGFLLLADGRAEEAAVHLGEAVRLKPDDAEAHRSLGVARQRLQQPAEAQRSFRTAIRLNPADCKARHSLAAALQAEGKTQDALAELGEITRLEPDHTQALFSLSGMAAQGQYQFEEQEIRRIEGLAARSDLPLDDRCRLHYALGQILDGAGNCAEAFLHFRGANELRQELDRRCGVVFNPAAHRRFIDRIIATFTPAYFERVRSSGTDSELPVFIVGMLRSGTSLAEQILASHPRVYGAGELRDMDVLVERMSEKGTDGYPECLAHVGAAAARSLAAQYLTRRQREGGPAMRVVDKNPLNFLHLGLIATLFPQARLIHCRRHPADTCLSCFFQNFAGPFPFVRDLRHLGVYYREYERLMDHWRRVLPTPFFELHYEELTANQEAVSRRLIAFCGLEWDERCLRFHETERPVWTASALQVRRPMYGSAVGRWKRYEAQLQPLLAFLRGQE